MTSIFRDQLLQGRDLVREVRTKQEELATALQNAERTGSIAQLETVMTESTATFKKFEEYIEHERTMSDADAPAVVQTPEPHAVPSPDEQNAGPADMSGMQVTSRPELSAQQLKVLFDVHGHYATAVSLLAECAHFVRRRNAELAFAASERQLWNDMILMLSLSCQVAKAFKAVRSTVNNDTPVDEEPQASHQAPFSAPWVHDLAGAAAVAFDVLHEAEAIDSSQRSTDSSEGPPSAPLNGDRTDTHFGAICTRLANCLRVSAFHGVSSTVEDLSASVDDNEPLCSFEPNNPLQLRRINVPTLRAILEESIRLVESKVCIMPQQYQQLLHVHSLRSGRALAQEELETPTSSQFDYEATASAPELEPHSAELVSSDFKKREAYQR